MQLNVTVRREELIFDETPLPGAPAEVPIPYAPPVVVVLREEVPVVTLITKPYEQATISVVQVAGEQQIVASLGSERLALDTDDQTNAAKATASNT